MFNFIFPGFSLQNTYSYDNNLKAYSHKPSPLWFTDNPVLYSFNIFSFYDNLFLNSRSHGFMDLTYSRLNKVVLNNPELAIPQISNMYWRDELPFEDFVYFKKSSFISFFINNMIDIPICFKKSKSLRYHSFELPLLKFSNFLMQKGKKEKVIRTLFLATVSMFLKLKTKNNFKNLVFSNWLEYYTVFNYFFFLENPITERERLIEEGLFLEEFEEITAPALANASGDEGEEPGNKKPVFEDFCCYDPEREINIYKLNSYFVNIDLPWDSYSLENFKVINNTFFIKNFLLNHLNKTFPIFLYSIYSVDKNVRKYSRGKSGKYSFVWKYIAPYKRLKLAMKLIAREIKFSLYRKLTDRISFTLEEIGLDYKNSFVWKAKVFSHNYVFKNYRKTLMSSLRTSS